MQRRITSPINKQALIYCFVGGLALVILGLVALAFLRGKGEPQAALKSLKTWQHADAPLGYPLQDGSPTFFDSRFVQLSAFDLAQLPTATRMSQPMGTRQGGLTYNAQEFGVHNKNRGGHHAGDDINGIGGMNTDLGDPVYTISRSHVVYRGEPSAGWGKTIITAHRTPEGDIHQVMYSHLHMSNVALGDTLARGEPIGEVGTANLHYPAHLHLETRDTRAVWIGSGYLNRPSEHTSPQQVIQRWSQTGPGMLYADPFKIIKDAELEALKNNLSISHPEKES